MSETELGTKPHLSDVIDFDRDIAGHRLIRLRAGVGAGKNYWVNELAKAGYKILLITSRVATAQAQAKKMGADRWIEYSRLIDLDWMFDEQDKMNDYELYEEYLGLIQTKVVCTNAHIEKFLTSRYDPNDSRMHIWTYFDFIILDEAHSLTEDATFSDAPFHVERFLKYAYKHSSHCKIILMSGTQEPIDWLFEEEEFKGKVHELDFFDQCEHVEPENVMFISRHKGLKWIRSRYDRRQRVIYFANTVESIRQLTEMLIQDGIPREDIGISYSNGEHNDEFDAFFVERRDAIREYLIEQERLLPEVKIWLTTTQNKEGVNILDEDIGIMLAESHKRTELIQMAGRVRNGLEYLLVVADARQHPTKSSAFEEDMDRSSVDIVRSSVRQAEEKARRRGKEFDLQSLIQVVYDKYPAIRYDPLTRDFYCYEGRIQGERQTRHDNYEMQDYLGYLEDYVFEYGLSTGRDMLRCWFPYSAVMVDDTARPSDVRKIILSYLKEKNYLNTTITGEQRNEIIAALNGMVREYRLDKAPWKIRLPIKSLNAVLKKVDLCIDPVGKHNGSKFIITDKAMSATAA